MEKSRREEFPETLCNLYMIFTLVVLPLYTNGTYYRFGDVKYDLFRNVSVICFVIWAVYRGVFLLQDCTASRGKMILRNCFDMCRDCSVTDIFVFVYGAVNIVAALFSSFGSIAWMGYRDWYMGAWSQVMFVGIYFFVSRYFARNALVIYAGEVSLLAVTVIGLLARLGIDLLGVYEGYLETDWEYSHMLSTIGNINWLCGYYSVMLALPVAGYLYSDKKRKEILLYIVSLLGMTLLCIQGSDSGFLIAAVGIGIGMIWSVKKPKCFRKVLLLAMGLAIMFPLMAGLIGVFEAQAATPVDGDVYAKMQWRGWWLIALCIGIVCLVQYRLKMSVQKKFAKLIVIICVVSAGMVSLLLLLSWSKTPLMNWGSGRGVLWKMAWSCFAEGDWKQKLIGAGPDCYAEYLISCGTIPTIDVEGHWSGAIYANAHNEWLTHLVNLGMVGVAAYGGIFVSAAKRYKGMLLGVLVLGMYGMHSLVSFQQVLNTPLFFLVLGMCENRCRSTGMSVESSDGTVKKAEKYYT